MAASLDEIFDQLVSDLLADTTLTGLLGDTDQIFGQFPGIKPKPPFIVVSFDPLGPQTELSGTGVYRPISQWDIVAATLKEQEQIFSHLEDQWTIPNNKSTPVTSTNYRIELLEFRDTLPIRPPRQLETDQQLRQKALTVAMRIVRTTSL